MFITVVMICAMTAGGLLVDGLPLIELAPTYICSNYTSDYTQEYKCVPYNREDSLVDYPTWCPEDPITGDTIPGNEFVKHWINTTNPTSLNNWYTQLGLDCKPKGATGKIGLFAFTGAAIGCLFMPRLGDLYGRRPVFLASLFLQGGMFAIATFWHNLIVLYVFAFLLGPVYIGRLASGFCLLMELVPKDKAPKVGAALMVC